MFAVFFLRKKYGPPIVVLVGVALLAVGIGVTNHAVTGIIGAAIVVVDAAAGVMQEARTLAASETRTSGDEAIRAPQTELDDTPVGFSTCYQIHFGAEAHMHLHIVDSERRAAGLGAQLVRLTAVHYCGVLRLARLYCEPNAFNVALQPHPCRAPAFATCAHGYAVPDRSTAT